MWWIPQTSNSLEGMGISFFFQHWSPDLRLCLFLPLYPLPTTLLHRIWSNGCNKLSLVWVSFLLLFTLWMVSYAKQHLLPWGILAAFFFYSAFSLWLQRTESSLQSLLTGEEGALLQPQLPAAFPQPKSEGAGRAGLLNWWWMLMGSRPA